MKRLGLVALVAVAACGPAPNLLPQDDLNRPTDVAFMCFGAFPTGTGTDGGVPDGGAGGALQVSGRPMRACHPQGQYDPGPTSTTRTFAFMPNSAAGTLSVVDADHWKLVDLDLDTAGYGTAPLGQLPEQISASDDGCRLISANRGSCDLTLVDPSFLVAPTFSSQNNVDVQLSSPRTGSQTFRPTKGDGTQLLAAPYEAVFLPQDTTSLVQPPASSTLPYLQGQGPLCGAGAQVDPINLPAKPIPNSWYALVTYPSCNLITLIALPSGKIIDSAKVSSSDGQTVQLTDTGPSPFCALSAGDCAGQVLPPQSPATDAAAGDGSANAGRPDAATGSGGTTGTGGSGNSDGGMPAGNQFSNDAFVGSPIGPSGIAIVPDGSRAYVSLANAPYVLAIDLSNGGKSLSGQPITLHEGARGSTRVRLNVDPNRAKTVGTAGVFAGEDPGYSSMEAGEENFAGLNLGRKYLYVIARDGTLRVIDVANPRAIDVANPPGEFECETNADPLNMPPNAHFDDNCIAVDPLHRRPFSVGPGIHFASLPIDVAAADIQRPGAGGLPVDTTEQSVNGAYAWVVAASGFIYLVNINPVLRNFSAVIPDPKNPNAYNLCTAAATASATAMPPSNCVTEPFPFVNSLRDRSEISFSVTLDPSSGPARVDIPPPVPATGPYIEPVWTRGTTLNATAQSGSYQQTFVFFPQIPIPQFAADPVDRRSVIAQTWTVAWEGALSGNRNSGKALPVPPPGPSAFPGFPTNYQYPGANPGLDSPFTDGGGNYCQSGVVKGDMIVLTGCTADSQCGIGETCVTGDTGSSVEGLAVTGICLDPNRAGAQMQTCNEFLSSLRRYEIVAASPSNVIMRPHLDEVVLSNLTTPCHPAIAPGADGGAGRDAGAPTPDSCPDTVDDPTTVNFQCVPPGPTVGPTPRCLMPCNTGEDTACRPGRVCVDFDQAPPGQTPHVKCSTGQCFCADAPVFDDAGKACFDQLLNYQVVAGKSFTVVGSQSGIVTTEGTLGDGTCDPNPTPPPGFAFRIPISDPKNAPKCTNVNTPGNPDVTMIDSRVDPDFEGAVDAGGQNAGLVQVVTTTPEPSSPCLYFGGPVSSDPMAGTPGTDAGAPPTHVRALFRNSQVSFLFANIDRGPTFQFATSFDVHGGFAPQLVQDPATIEVGMPARIVVGPVDSLAQVMTGTTMPTYEAPYLFVVDQRRLGRSQGGGPTRGQLLRINPFGYQSTVTSVTGYQPIFEDYNASGGLFPIQ